MLVAEQLTCNGKYSEMVFLFQNKIPVSSESSSRSSKPTNSEILKSVLELWDDNWK